MKGGENVPLELLFGVGEILLKKLLKQENCSVESHSLHGIEFLSFLSLNSGRMKTATHTSKSPEEEEKKHNPPS